MPLESYGEFKLISCLICNWHVTLRHGMPVDPRVPPPRPVIAERSDNPSGRKPRRWEWRPESRAANVAARERIAALEKKHAETLRERYERGVCKCGCEVPPESSHSQWLRGHKTAWVEKWLDEQLG